VRIGLLGVEAVAAVVLEEKWCETEVGADVAGWVHGLVGQDRHQDFGVGSADRCERFEDAWIEKGVVEFVDAVVVEEECKCFSYIFFIVNISFGVAKSPADEEGSSVADVTRDDGFG